SSDVCSSDLELAEGDVAVEVVGRPVFLLQGDIPMYRDLRPGATGDDVLQLEEALARLGVFAGEPDGTWDQMTGAAVAAWYEQAGYRPNGLSDEDEEALRAARDRVRAAAAALADAESALREAAQGSGRCADDAAVAALADAEPALREAQQGSGRSALAAAEAELNDAERALELARIDADRANELAARAVSDAEAELARAEAGLAAAEDALAAGQAADPPLAPDEMAALEQAVAEAEATVAAAEDALDQARFEVDRTAKEQEALVAAANDRVQVARAALSDARRG